LKAIKNLKVNLRCRKECLKLTLCFTHKKEIFFCLPQIILITLEINENKITEKKNCKFYFFSFFKKTKGRQSENVEKNKFNLNLNHPKKCESSK